MRTSGASINTPYEKEISHEIPTFGQLRTPGFGGGARHNDLRRRMGLGFSQGRSAQGVRRLSRGRGNFIDTANFYTNGTSESFLGEFIKDDRQSVVLATKYSNAAPGTDPNAAGNQRKNMMQAG